MSKRNAKILDSCMLFLVFLAFHVLQLFILPCIAGAPIPQSEYCIGDHIKNIVFYIIFWAYIMYVMSGIGLPTKHNVKYFVYLLVLQALFSGIKWTAAYTKTIVFFLVCELCIPLQWVLVCNCINKNYKGEKEKRKILLPTLCAVVLLLLSMAIDITMAIRMDEMNKMYLHASSQLTTKSNNLFFVLSLKNAVVESTIASVLFSSYRYCEHVEQQKMLPRRFSQALLSTCLVVVVYVGCAYFAPNHCIREISFANQRSMDRDELNCSTRVVRVRRFTENNSSIEEAYCATRCVVYRGEKEITVLHADGALPAFSVKRENDVPVMKDVFTEVSYNDSIIGFFFDEAIVIVHDEESSVIYVKDIPQQNENPELLYLCRQLAEDHNFISFPYYAEYLLRWDKDYIVPLLKSYSSMNDSSLKDEIEKSGLQYEYIRNEAIELLGDGLS